MRVWLILGMLVTVWLRTSSVCACSPVVRSYATLRSISPEDGSEGFPRDGAILVELERWIVQPRSEERVEVRVVRMKDGREVEGIQNDYPPNSNSVSWSANEPFEANTTYRVEVRTTSSPRDDIDEPTSGTSTFTTSETMSPRLEIEGALRAKLVAGAADVQRCSTMCGAPCEKVGERPALYAEVEGLRVRGGYDAHGYLAWLSLNNDAARTFDGPGEGKIPRPVVVNLLSFLELEPEEDARVRIEVPRESTPYAACFGFNVWDSRRHAQHAEPVCIPAAEVEAAFQELDRADEDADHEAVASCTVARLGLRAAAPTSAWSAVTLFVAMSLRRRARRWISRR